MDDLAADVSTALDTLRPVTPEPIPAQATAPVEQPAPAPATPTVEPRPAPAASNQDPNPLPGTILDDPDFEPTQRTVVENPLLSRLAKGHDRSHIDNLDGEFSGSLQRMLSEAPPHVRDAITINSGFRSEARQKELFDAAVQKYGSVAAARRWVAPPGSSQHGKGNAMDLGYGNDEARKWVHANASKYGLAFPMAHEPWHVEPINARQKSPGTAPNTLVIPSDVKTILEEASARTGVDINELARAAKQESDYGRNVGKGSARGMFQFMPGTWQFALREWGDIHGIPSNASPDDHRYNAILGAEYIKHVKDQIEKKTGRYAPGEYYLGHFLGPSGGSSLIKLALSDPNAPAAASFPKAAANNQTVFYNRDGTPKTAKQIYDWAVGIGGGNAPPATIVGSGTATSPGLPAYSRLQNAPQAIVGSTEAKLREDARGAESDGSYLKLVADTFKYESTPGMLFARQSFAPNPASIPDLDATIAKWQNAGISQELIEKRIPEIVSAEHEDFLYKQSLAETSHHQNIAQLGVGGIGANILVNMLDPIAIGASILSGGIANFAVTSARLGRGAMIVSQAVAGATSNVGIEYAQQKLGSSTAFQHPALTVAFGAAFGSLGGVMGRNPYTRVEASRIADMAEADVARLQSQAQRISEQGNLSAALDPNADIPLVNDAAIRAVSDNDIPYTAWGAIRWDITGRMKNSKNPLTRGLGALFGEDAIGNKDKAHANTFSADQDMQRRHDRNTLEMWRSFHPSFDDWGKEKGYNAVTKRLHYKQFFDELYDVDTGLVPKDAHGPAIQRMSAKLDKLYEARSRDLQNPRHEEGQTAAAYPGFEAGAPVKNYRPRIYDLAKANDFRTNGGGDAGIRAWFRGAMKSADPTMDDDVLDKMSEGFAKNLHLRSEGVWEDLEKVKGGDKVGLANMLSDLGLNKDEIERAIAKFAPAEKAGDARGKHRAILDETYVLQQHRMKDGSTRDVTLKDFVKTNPIENYISYDRWHSGRMALMRARLEGGVDPEDAAKRTLLVDGFRTQADFDGFLKHVQAKGAELSVGAKQMGEDLENLKWMHDRLLGRPDPNLQGSVPQFLRALRKFNFVRLMGQMGFAQAVEHGKIVGTLGLKATYSQVPSFRRIVDPKGQLVMKNELARELEAIGGQGADGLRGLQNMHAEDLHAPQYEGVGRKINFALDVGQRVTSIASGMHFVDGMLMRHAQKAIAQKFADMALKAVKGGEFKIDKIGTADLNRLRTIGLDDKTLQRVLKQVRDHVTTADGALFGHKVTRLNLDGWADQEARAAFEKSLYNWSRRIILRNDLGNGARWLSTPLATTMFQFRSFMLNSWAKDTLYQLRMGDLKSFATVTYSMMFAAMVYAVQTRLQMAGRSDAERELEKRLAFSNLVKAGVQRSGPSSIIPMLADTAISFTGYDPLFDFRSSAQPSDLLFGNPTMGLLNDAQKAGASIWQPMFSGRTMSRQDYRNIYRVLPFQNSMPLMNLYSTMISDAPERSEKLSKEQRKLF